MVCTTLRSECMAQRYVRMTKCNGQALGEALTLKLACCDRTASNELRHTFILERNKYIFLLHTFIYKYASSQQKCVFNVWYESSPKRYLSGCLRSEHWWENWSLGHRRFNHLETSFNHLETKSLRRNSNNLSGQALSTLPLCNGWARSRSMGRRRNKQERGWRRQKVNAKIRVWSGQQPQEKKPNGRAVITWNDSRFTISDTK